MIKPARFPPGATLILVMMMLLYVSASGAQTPASDEVVQPRPQKLLGMEFLLGKAPLAAPLATSAFTPPETSSLPTQPFNGLLTFATKGAFGGIKIHVDTFDITSDKQSNLAVLPPFTFEYVSDGPVLIPAKREPQRSNHPYWEIMLEPGRSWTDANDMGWSRASLPFSLKEKNQNCLHNGLLTFLYKTDGSISRVAWQVTSETCLYLKVDLWGMIDAEYAPGPVPASSEIISAYRKHTSRRLPAKSFSSLAVDYPGLEPTAFRPTGAVDVSVYGFFLNSVHYRSECPTRYGPYPFCDVLDLPSYSLAKSVFGGLAYLLLSSQWPEFAAIPVSRLIPECKLPDQRWNEVTPAHLVNMTTGNYRSAVFNADEDNDMDAFFVAQGHGDKLRFSCEAWPRQSPAGTQWVYHTTDTYLLGVAMNNYLKQKLGDEADIHRDLLYAKLFRALELSPVLSWSQRTYDDRAQPFTGYGLVFQSDDLLRIALALNSDSGVSNILSSTDFDTSMFRDGAPWPTPPAAGGMAYSLGFWGVDVSGWIGCPTATWIPFMSGYGGIVVALLPNGGVYYFFTDSNQHGFRKAAVEAHKALNFCKE